MHGHLHETLPRPGVWERRPTFTDMTYTASLGYKEKVKEVTSSDLFSSRGAGNANRTTHPDYRTQQVGPIYRCPQIVAGSL